jgi:hypothetical protein
LDGVPALENVRANEALAILVNSMDNRPHDADFQEGSEAYPIALHNSTDERSTVASEIVRLCKSELGRAYLKADSTLFLEARSTRSLSIVADYSLIEFLEAEIERRRGRRYNRVRVTGHPARVDVGLEVLYAGDSPVQVDNGAAVELFFQYRDPASEAVRVSGIDLVTPEPTTDYLINETQGSPAGADLTAHPAILLEWRLGANGAYLTITNGYGQPVFLTIVQIRGRGIYDYDAITVIREDKESIRRQGLQPFDLDMPYQQDANVLAAVADRILNEGLSSAVRCKSGVFTVATSEAVETACLQSEISDRVALEEPVTALDGQFHVQGKRLVIRPVDDIDVQLWFAPADAASYWILNESALDETTRLGY